VREQDLPPEAQAGNRERLRQAVSEMNTFLQNLQRDLKFEVDTELGQTVISVVDSETKELIRQIPSEEVLERARRLEQGDVAGTVTDGLLLKVQA
jgi:flagellar protein FlaG